MSLSRALLRQRVSGAIGLSNTAGGTEQLLIDGWLEEAVEQFLIDTKCSIDTASMSLTAGIGDYALPASALAIQHLWIVAADGTITILDPTSTQDILERRRFGATGYGPQVYAVEGYDFLRIQPVAQSSSDVLHFDYVPAPGAWVSPTTLTPPFVPSWGHPAIEEYAKWKAADWDDDTSSKIGERYQQGYQVEVKKARMRLTRMAGKWGPARIGKSSRRNIPARPGVDLG